MRAYQNILPQSWPLIPFGAICEVGAGNGAPQGDVYYVGGTHPFVRMQDVGRCQTPYIITTADRLNDLALEKYRLRKWPAKSLLIPKSGASVALNKRALLSEPSYVVSHLAVLIPGPLLDSEYLYHLSCTLDMMRLALDPSYPSLRTSDLAKLRIPLPPLSEQRRIVEILQEAEEIRRLRAEAEAKTAELIPAIFYDHFVIGQENDFQQLHKLADVVSGVALGRKTKGMTAEIPYLRVANVQDGFVDLGEIKTTGATEEEVLRFELKKGDVLLTEGGDFDKLGRGCLWEGQVKPCIHQNHIFRVRPIPDKLNSHFFSHYLQSAYAKHYFLRCAKKTTNFTSINLTQLKALPVPNVLIEDQKRFELQIKAAVECTSINGDKAFGAFIQSLSAHAFSGQLTADWREKYHDMLALEARDRDAALKEEGAALTVPRRATIQELEDIVELPTSGIYAELNSEQRFLLSEIGRMVGGVRYARYFSAQTLSEYLSKGVLRRNPHAVEGHLSVLAARGLIIPVSREEQTEDTGVFVFGNAYRLPLKDNEQLLTTENGDGTLTEAGEELIVQVGGDQVRLSEMERLAAQLEKERSFR